MCLAVLFFVVFHMNFIPYADGVSNKAQKISIIRKDFTFHTAGNGWVKLHRTPLNWFKARLRCHAEGAILASPLNEEVQATMQSIMGARVHSVFTGISSTIAKGEFYSLEGVPLDEIPTNWVPSEPGQHECLIMYSNGTLSDYHCDQPRPYICYKKNTLGNDVPNPSRCGHDPEYIFQQKTGHCYKFHTVGQTWKDSFKICSIEGAYLAIINSEEEAQIIKNLIDIQPSGGLIDTDKDFIGIGFHAWNRHNLWMTVHGETLKEAGYEVWADKQPDNNTMMWKHGEYCGAIDRIVTLHDVGCGYAIPFICEMNVE